MATIEEVPQVLEVLQETPVVQRKTMDRPVAVQEPPPPPQQSTSQKHHPPKEDLLPAYEPEDDTDLPNFVDMVIEVPVQSRNATTPPMEIEVPENEDMVEVPGQEPRRSWTTLPMVIEYPKFESDSDEDDEDSDEDDDVPTRAWCVMSVADDASFAEEADEKEDHQDDDDLDEIHNKVRNLATLLRRQTGPYRPVSKLELRTN
jgi:hypothetical protein